jgi:hypothetical protein
MDDYTKTLCYECKEKQAVVGEVFPFCSVECKEKWGESHYKNGPRRSRYRTIEEIQKKIKEIQLERREKNRADGSDQTYEIAKSIFG